MVKYLGFTKQDDLEELMDEMVIIHAYSEEEAFTIFANNYSVRDTNFLEHMQERSINMSFAEQFWLKSGADEDEEAYCDEEQFKKNVIEFYSPNIEFAQIFLNYFINNDNTPFPAEMVQFSWIKACHTDHWATVLIIELDEIPVLNEYENVA